MSDIKVAIGFLAAIIVLGGFVCYCYDIRKRNTQPDIVSWFIWLILAVILGLSCYASGARQTAMIYASAVLGNSCIIIMSLKRGGISWNKRNVCYLFAGVFIVVIWKSSNSPILAQYASLLLHAVGAIPTFEKTWKKPHNESRLAWIVLNTGNMVNILAIKQWVARIWIAPIYVTAHSTAMVLLLLILQKTRKGGAK